MSRRTYLDPKWKPGPSAPRNNNQPNFNRQQGFGRPARFMKFNGRRSFQPQFKTVYNGIEDRGQAPDDSSDDTEAGNRRREVRKRVRTQIDRIVGDVDGVNSQSPPLKLHRVYTAQNRRSSVLKRMEDMIREDNDEIDWDTDDDQHSHQNKQQKVDELQTFDVRIQAIAKRIMKLKETQPIGWVKELEKLEAMQLSLEEKRFDLMQTQPSNSKRLPNHPQLGRRRSSRCEKQQRPDQSTQRRQTSGPQHRSNKEQDSDASTTLQESSDNEADVKEAVTKDDIRALRARLTSCLENLTANPASQPQPTATAPVSQISTNNKSRRSDISDPYQTPKQRFSDNDDSPCLKEKSERNVLGILSKKLDVNYKGTLEFPFDAAKVAARIVGHFPCIPLRESDQRSSYIKTCIGVLVHRLDRAREVPEENRERSASDEIMNRTTSIERREESSPPILGSNAQADENIFGEDDHLAMAAIDHPSFYAVDSNNEDIDENGMRSHSPILGMDHEKTPPLERFFNETIRGVRELDNAGDFTINFGQFVPPTVPRTEGNKSHQTSTTIIAKTNSQVLREGLSDDDSPQILSGFQQFSSPSDATSPPFFDHFAGGQSSHIQVDSRSSSTPSFLKGMAFTSRTSEGNLANLMTPQSDFGHLFPQQSRLTNANFSQARASQSSRGAFDWFNKFDANNQFG
ncbi:unnamed protein product, partial [Mesorhabditis belari]|uniref:Uncharacterized protein n=1 Tax=Mesorhabditis belari TaxID=2138241 RepID=A0AAF3FDA6_9BILA